LAELAHVFLIEDFVRDDGDDDAKCKEGDQDHGGHHVRHHWNSKSPREKLDHAEAEDGLAEQRISSHAFGRSDDDGDDGES